MTVTLLAGVEVVPYTFDTGTGLIPYAASGTPLPDGSVLIAALAPHGIVVRRYTRDLTTLLGETTVGDGDTTGVALWVGTDGTPMLASSNRLWRLDPATLAATQVGTHPTAQWIWASGRTTLGDASILLGNFTIAVHRPGQPLAVHRTDEDVSSVWVDNGTAFVALNPWADGDPDRYLEARPFDPATGTIGAPVNTVATPGQILSGAVYVPDSSAALSFEDRPDLADGKIRLRTAAGVIADPDQPAGVDNYLHASIAAAAHPTGGTLAAVFHGRDGDNFGTGVSLAHATNGGITITPLPLPTVEYVRGTTSDSTVTVAVHGNTALVAVVGYQRPGYFGAEGRYGLTAWTIDLGSVDSRLHVGILGANGPIWRKVGDESWDLGPGRLKLRVGRGRSESGWLMEVKPGDDTTNAETLKVGTADGHVQTLRMIPWPGRTSG